MGLGPVLVTPRGPNNVLYMILCANHGVSLGLHLATSFDRRKVCDSCDHRHDHTILIGQTARVDRIVRTLRPSPKVMATFHWLCIGYTTNVQF